MATREPSRSKSLSHNAPYGYRWDKGVLAPDPVEAPVRKRMYELLASLRRKKAVARTLNGEGYRTRNGALWSDTTIDRLIRDTVAKGIYSERSEGPGTPVEAIVSEELWEECNGLLSGSGLGSRRGRQAHHIFAGLVVCECGRRMYIPSNSRNYRCVDCGNRIPADDLETLFVSELRRQPSGENDRPFGEVCDRWSALERGEKRAIIESITDRIRVGKDEIDITFHQISPEPCDNPRGQVVGGSTHTRKPRNERVKREEAGLRAAVDPVALAIALMKDHPGWSARKLAEAAGCSHTTLTRSAIYRTARVLADAKVERPRGWKDASGKVDGIVEDKGEE